VSWGVNDQGEDEMRIQMLKKVGDGRRSRSVLTRTGDADHITCNTNPTAFITASPAMSSKPVAQLSAHSSKLAIAGDL